jgi:hypothetical protein
MAAATENFEVAIQFTSYTLIVLMVNMKALIVEQKCGDI